MKWTESSGPGVVVLVLAVAFFALSVVGIALALTDEPRTVPGLEVAILFGMGYVIVTVTRRLIKRRHLKD